LVSVSLTISKTGTGASVGAAVAVGSTGGWVASATGVASGWAPPEQAAKVNASASSNAPLKIKRTDSFIQSFSLFLSGMNVPVVFQIRKNLPDTQKLDPKGFHETFRV
jgi:hypothetical protein